MNVSNRIFSYIDEVGTNASSLSSAVASVRGDWKDANYEHIAEATASRIQSEANAFCSNAMSDAQMVYHDMMSIQTIINDL